MRDCERCGDETDPNEMCRKCFTVALGVVIMDANRGVLREYARRTR